MERSRKKKMYLGSEGHDGAALAHCVWRVKSDEPSPMGDARATEARERAERKSIAVQLRWSGRWGRERRNGTNADFIDHLYPTCVR
jgi:hypothetical protein